jgi:hypothetical protein
MSTKERYSHELAEVIAKAKTKHSRESLTTRDGTEIYAYPKPEGRIAWGVNAAETGWNILSGIRQPDGTDEAEVKPEEHQKAAAGLRELADLSTKPNEKRGLLGLAAGFESLAKLGENEALLLDVRAELGEVRNEVGELRKEVTAIQNNLITLRADLPGIIASAVAAIMREEMARKG